MTIQRYSTSCAPREDGVFVHFTEYEKVVEECERLRNAEAMIRSFVAALLSNNLERAGDATRRMTEYALDCAQKEQA